MGGGEGEGVAFVIILHFIILNNLFGRESYWYCLVHMVKFIIWEEVSTQSAFTHGNKVKL